VKADKVMSNAKEEAVRIKAHAHEEAEKQIADARTQAERVLTLSLSVTSSFTSISKEIGADFWMLWNFVSAGETKLGEGIDWQFFADNLNIDMLAMGLELGLIDLQLCFALFCFACRQMLRLRR
jgi:hypothetical protein